MMLKSLLAWIDRAFALRRINRAASVFIELLGPSFTGTPAGHIETDIAATAAVAGSVVFTRNSGTVRLPAGTIILSDIHDDEARLMDFMRQALAAARLDSDDGWGDDIPPEHEPMYDVATLVSKLRPHLDRVVHDAGVPGRFHGHVAALGAAKLVFGGHQTGALDQKIGKAIAGFYLSAGCRTVPGQDDKANRV